jgi:hypothetical protein
VDAPVPQRAEMGRLIPTPLTQKHK